MKQWRGPAALGGILLGSCVLIAGLTYIGEQTRSHPVAAPTAQPAPPPAASTAAAVILAVTPSATSVPSSTPTPVMTPCAAPTAPSGSVAGSHDASPESPAGGGLYKGQNDAQIVQLFQQQDGPNWQVDWATEHRVIVCGG